MIKCASTTLNSIFHRFGYSRNLSFVLPIAEKIYLGWPYLINQTFHRARKTENFNLLTEHSVYNPLYMKNIMPADTVYLTSIREPYQQFVSMFNYYKLESITKMNAKHADFVSHKILLLPELASTLI